MNLQKNQIIELDITSMTTDGNGVGKTYEGIAVFVPQSAVGDKLSVKILKTKKKKQKEKTAKLKNYGGANKWLV